MQICNRTKFPNNVRGGMTSHRAVENHLFIFNHVVIFLDPDHRWHWKLAFHYMVFLVKNILHTNDAESFVCGDGLAALVLLAELAQVLVLGVLDGELHDRQAVGANFELIFVKVFCDLLLDA